MRTDEPLRVALPLGIGDCHWSCQKLQGLRQLHPDRPLHAYISSSRWHDSVEYLKLVPFVDAAFRSDDAPYALAQQLPPHHQDPRWSTLEGCANWNGFDYVIQANGHLETGGRIETFLPTVATQYTYELQIPEEESAKARALVGDGAVLLYLSGVGPNLGFHMNRFTPAAWVEIILRLNKEGVRPTILGAPTSQDRDYAAIVLGTAQKLGLQFRDLVGDTTIPMVCDIMRRASVWMGLNSGLGIVSAMMGTPTVMFWSDSAFPIPGVTPLHTNMRTSWLAPWQLERYRTFSYGDPSLSLANVVGTLFEVRR